MLKRLNPLFKHFGSSWSSAKHYPKPLEDLPIFEPFAGGAGYSLNYHWLDAHIYDTNQYVAALWQWIISDATSADVLDIPLGVPEGTDIRNLGLSAGQQLLLKHWQRTNNHGNCFTVSAWGAKPGQWTVNTRSRVAEQIHAVKHWKFCQPDWTQVGTWFIDPPYQYNHNYGVKNFDYVELAQKVLALPAKSLVIASEAVCPKTGAKPDYLTFRPSHSQVTSRRKITENHHSKELVYVRHPMSEVTC